MSLDRELARALTDAGYMKPRDYARRTGQRPLPDDLAPLRNFAVNATIDLSIVVAIVAVLCAVLWRIGGIPQ